MSDWISKARNAQRKAYQKSGPDGKPYLGIVNGLNPDTDRCGVVHIDKSVFRVHHPYLGPNSWIRVGPERGAGVLLQQRWDTQEQEVVGYYNKYPERLIDGYKEGRTIARPMREGEIELSSVGMSQAFLDRRGSLMLRGGIVWSRHDNDMLNHAVRAPWHHRQLANNTMGSLGDEERFGIVVRPGLLLPSVPRYMAIGPIAFKEYYRSLATDRIVGGKLTEHQEGDVLDTEGLPVLSSFTGLPLRSSRSWFNESGQATTTTIDSIGNVDMSLPSAAVMGAQVNIPSGNLSMTVGLTTQITSRVSMSLDTTGTLPTSTLFFDGIPWRHMHITPMGLSGIPVPG